jgi:hypothetical protein
MRYSSAILALSGAVIALAVPVPLNINLGAYSPALVVGDGEIGFSGANAGNSVAQIMNTLQGAAASNAAANGAATPAAAAAQAAQPAAITQTDPAAGQAAVAVPDQLQQGMGKNVVVARDETEVEKRDLAGFNAALSYASGALKTSPEVQLGTGAEGSGVGIIVAPKTNTTTKAAKREMEDEE